MGRGASSGGGWLARLSGLSWGLALVLGVLALGLGAQVLGWGPFGWKAWLLPWVGGELGSLGDATLARYQERAAPLQTRQAVDVASGRLASGLEPAPTSPEGVARLLGALRRDGAFERAEGVLARSRQVLGDASALDAEEVRLLLAMNRPEAARSAAWSAVERHGGASAPGPVRAALWETFRQDRDFDDGRLLTLQAGRDLQALVESPRLGGGLEATTPSGEVAIFVPEREGGGYGHWGALAGLRLCRLLGCALHVPDARLAKIEPNNLSFLLKQGGAAAPPGVRRHDRDGAWVSGAWVRLHRSGQGAGVRLGEPALLERLLSGEAPAEAPGSAAAVVEASGGGEEARGAVGERSAAWLAGQVSDAWVLAYLLRAPKEPEVSPVTPLGAQPVWLLGAFTGEERSLEPLQRLRPETARGLRLLDPAEAGPWLFPGSGEDAAKAEEAAGFWRRREALLRHVEALEARRGAEALLPRMAEK